MKVEMDQAPVKKSPLPVPGGEPPSTLYQAPTEPVVLAPLVESVDLKQQQIDLLLKQGQEAQRAYDSLTEQLSTLANQFSAYIQAVHGTQQ